MAPPNFVAPSPERPLARGSLDIEQDIVSLCRRARAVAQEMGVEAQEARALSAATYELARRLREIGVHGEAELGYGNGALEVVVRGSAAPDATTSVSEVVAPLRPIVRDLGVTSSSQDVSLSVSVPVRGDSAEVPPAPHTDRAHAHGGVREEALRAALRDVQEELEQTNRGVVALYAELDDRAERLREAEDRLRLLLDSVQDYAIFMASPAGTVTSWNHGAERIFGRQAGDMAGRQVRELFPSSFFAGAENPAGSAMQLLHEAEARGRVERDGPGARADGSTFAASVIVLPVRPEGELKGFSFVVRDVTERERLERDLRRRAEDLAAANRAKEEFLATLSHELRTPLNAMLGWTRLLRMGRMDAAGVERALEIIERNARLQEQLIADILDVSRIVTGKLRLDVRRTDLATLLDAAIDSVRPAAEAKGIDLQVDVRFRGHVTGDPHRLQQVIWNLLSNAIKFTDTGGQVRATLERQENLALLTVTDTGEGIALELLPFVFDRFRQGDASATRSHGGLGLGLSIVRHIVELHGGTVQVSSEGVGRGATFGVRLPIAF